MSRRMIDRQTGRARWLVAVVLMLATTALYGAIRFTQGPPDGVQEIAWDLEPCAHCHMHVGDPSFAAQLQTTEGDVLNFDDPGCLMRYEAEKRPSVHAIYFHARGENRWIPKAEVAFVPVPQSPMGYGLGAVVAGRPGAGTSAGSPAAATPAFLTYEAAQAKVTRKPPSGQGG